MSIHVVKHGRGWAVKRDNLGAPTAVLSTQRAAIGRARELARREHTELVVHRADGTVGAS